MNYIESVTSGFTSPLKRRPTLAAVNPNMPSPGNSNRSSATSEGGPLVKRLSPVPARPGLKLVSRESVPNPPRMLRRRLRDKERIRMLESAYVAAAVGAAAVIWWSAL